MKEKPILFSTPMVQAILDGRKTQTRRVIKPQPTYKENSGFGWNGYAYGTDGTENGALRNFVCAAKYQRDDILWVRETWYRHNCAEQECILEESVQSCQGVTHTSDGYCFIYKAEDNHNYYSKTNVKWKPSIHMPREAARIFLRVTNVRVERVRDISEDDAIAEGCEYERYGKDFSVFYSVDKLTPVNSSRAKFGNLWNELYAKRGYGWDVNPWVWVYKFERISAE